MFQRLLNWVRHQWVRLLTLQDAPHAVAGGMAIGLIIGFSPLFSIKTLLAIVIAWLCRCSKLAAVIVVTLNDLLLPIEPLILRWQYALGHWLLSSPHQWPKPVETGQVLLHWREWFTPEMLTTVIWPTLVGSLMISIPVAALLYWPVLRMVRRVPPEMLPQSGGFAPTATKDSIPPQ